MYFINLSGFINVIVFGGVYTIIYCLTCYFITMNKYEKGFINKILIKLKLKKV